MDKFTLVENYIRRIVREQKFKEVTVEDYLKTIDVPKLSDKAVIGEKEIEMMKDRVGIINAARGGVIDEEALIKAIEKGKVMAAGLDVFDNEPTPSIKLLI